MNQSETELVLVLDASGSMLERRAETVHAVNKFIAEQKLVPGAARVTIVLFNYGIIPYYSAMPLEMAQPLLAEAYDPKGGTALLDAVGTMIDKVGARLRGLPDRTRPAKVVFVVVTDGEENISTKFTKAEIMAKIEHQKSKYAWQFLFLGAEASAFDEARAIGLSYTSTMSWEPDRPDGILRAMAASSNAVSSYRSGGAGAQAVYSVDDRVLNNSK